MRLTFTTSLFPRRDLRAILSLAGILPTRAGRAGKNQMKKGVHKNR